MDARIAFARIGALMSLLLLGSCGGGGGGGGSADPPVLVPSCTFSAGDFVGVCSGFAGNMDWSAGGDGSGGAGDGGGASGDGGVGAGGDAGQFRATTVKVYKDDGTLLGTAVTDNTGMVTIRPGRTYRGALRVEFHGGDGATYFEEGKNVSVPFPAGRVMRVIVPRIDKNIGITPFTEAAYQLLTEGSTPERVNGIATPAQIRAANSRVRDILNDQFPKALHVVDITLMPVIKSEILGAASMGVTDDTPATAISGQRGRYGLVNGAFSKQAALFNTSRSAPTLDAVAQLGKDLLDGQLDGRSGNAAAAPVELRTYDANTITGELSSALAEQAERFGKTDAFNALPKVLNFGNTRYKGYLFDGAVTRERKAFSKVAGWVSLPEPNPRPLGEAEDKFANVAGNPRVFGMYANFGHGGALFKTDTVNSQGKLYALGDNVNGELGLGTTTSTNGAVVELTLPAVLTHAAGGFAHTVVRLADGSVYAWGDNSFGQLGQGGAALARSTTPLRVPLPAGGAVAVAATNVASYVLMSDGTVYAWGSNGGFGLLGNGQRDGTVSTPTLVVGLSDVVQIGARDNDAIAVRRDNTLWQWGSFPASDPAFTDTVVDTPYTGGNLLPVELRGLPAGAPVRKVLTEQGLVAALLGNGEVWTWGVYFDLTANAVLRDLTATRVLGLPKMRDIMPGGFNGYGSRPFDRNTAMGVDYTGGMWKIRGRVAEQYDPDQPQLVRRPLGQAARADCQSCHTAINEWPLVPPAPTSAAVCVPTPVAHGSVSPPSASLIHSDTRCETCHNPARTTIAAFPTGWLTCVTPTNLPVRPAPASPSPPSASCSIPVGHVFTPPGTVCANCHNAVLARTLLALGCAQPPGAALPTLATVSRIVTIVNGASATVASGAWSANATLTLSGTLSAALGAGQSLDVLRNNVRVGAASVSGTAWTFGSGTLPDGAYEFTTRVVEGATGFGATSAGYSVRIDTTPPAAVAAVTAVVDDANGNAVIVDNGFTADSTPTINGTLSVALGAGEQLRLLRSGTSAATVVVSPTTLTWTYVEPTPLALGNYTYRVQVFDAAGNAGPSTGAQRSFTLVTAGGLATPAINSIEVSGVGSVGKPNGTVVADGSAIPDASPTLKVQLSSLPAGQVIEVERDGVVVASGSACAAPAPCVVTLTDPGPASEGAHDYRARVAAGAVRGALSATYRVTVDTIAPATAPTIRLYADNKPFQNLVAATDPARQEILATPTPAYTTSDVDPIVEITFTALASGERVEVTESCINNCPAPRSASFTASTAGQTLFTRPSSAVAPLPAVISHVTPSATNNIAVLVGAQRVDAAGNASPAVSFTYLVDYLPCSQNRAQLKRPTQHATWPAGTAGCVGCHTGLPNSAGFVHTAAPAIVTTPVDPYICRKP